MNNENYHIDPHELIGKYMAGDATAEEITLLENWVKLNPENRQIFADYKRLWILSGIRQQQDQFNPEQEWEKLESRLFKGSSTFKTEVNKAPVFSLRPLLRYAAIFIAVAALAGILYYLLSKPSWKELKAGNAVVTSLLPDGSEITLNLNSVLVYPSKFRGNTRSVKLEGDAFFKITPDPLKPFIIEAGQAKVKVIGTSFYINARPEAKVMEVTVSTGQVMVISGKESIKLIPGEKGSFDWEKGTLTKISNTDPNFISWKTKVLVFKDERLETVFRKLEQVYKVSIRTTTPAINQCRLTATFDQQSPETIMEIIRATFDLEVKIQGTLVEVSGNGCGE